jgi:hypothetical protein
VVSRILLRIFIEAILKMGGVTSSGSGSGKFEGNSGDGTNGKGKKYMFYSMKFCL